MDRSIVIGLISFAVTASVLAIPTIGNAQASGGWIGAMSRAQLEDRIAERFSAADADGSGALSREEAEAYRAARRAARQARRFARIDSDGDGEISVEERNAAQIRRIERRGVRRSDMIADNSNMRARLSESELAPLRQGRNRRAAQADAEAPAALSRDRAWREADADGNGSLNSEEFSALRAVRHERHAHRRTSRFDDMDSNNDSQLSLAEFSARPRAMFTRADTDGDGVVTIDERRAMRDARRAEWRAQRGERND